MVKRTYNLDENEPEEKKFDYPSEKEHLFQVVDFIDQDNPDVVLVKLEVVGGEEAGRTLLNRCNLDQSQKGFFFTRLFLKAIGEPYKGQFDIETDRWVGRQLYATVKHNGKYANVGEYNFTKVIDQYKPPVGTDIKDVQWDT